MNGWRHSAMSTGLAFGVGCGYAAAYFFSPDQVVVLAGGALLGTMVTPDWDVDNGNISHYFVRKVFGEVGESAWGLFLRPYARALAHRNFLSHFPVISTLFRLTYVLLPIIILFTPFRKSDSLALIYAQLLSASVITLIYFLVDVDLYLLGYYVLPLILGLILSDVLHIIFDLL